MRSCAGVAKIHTRAARADAVAEEMLAIADDRSGDTVTKIGKDGQEYEAVDNENIQRAKLRVDTPFIGASHPTSWRWGRSWSARSFSDPLVGWIVGSDRDSGEDSA